jgi:asparagine synthase (glutamine-hydrolysing)
MDMWWKGQNIALDPGTFSYNSPQPWNNPFAHSAYHNTVTVDGVDQMDRMSKFIWLPWLKCKVIRNEKSAKGYLSYFEGEHDGYKRLTAPVSHQRGLLRIGEEHWLVLDRLFSNKEHTYRLHWLCPDLPFSWNEKTGNLQIKTSMGEYQIKLGTVLGKAAFSLRRASNESPRGWYSPYYNFKKPAISIDLQLKSSSAIFLSLFGPAPTSVTLYGEQIEITLPSLDVRISLTGHANIKQSIFDSISLYGHIQDGMVII